MKKAWERGQSHYDAFYVDAGLTLNNTVAQTLTPGAGATVNNTAGVTFTAGGSVFVGGDVGRYIHYDYVDEDGIQRRANARITGYTSGTVVTATILYPWPNTDLIASAGWRMTVTTVSGLWHLEGAEVAVYADGATLPNRTVASGAITLSYPASKVAVGLAYMCDARTMRPEVNGQQGSTQGKLRRIHRLVMRVHDTLGIKLGPTFDKLTQVVFRTSANDASIAPPLYSGDKIVQFEGDSDTDGYICLRHEQPEPCTVLALMPELNVSES
jgi:phage terminase large subunit-like protein